MAWRAAAHGTAQLWTCIKSDDFLVTVADHIAYSAALPLHLEWCGWRRDRDSLASFLGRVGPHSQRVESVYLRATCDAFAAAPAPEFSALRRAHIIICYISDAPDYCPGALDFLTNATALDDLTLHANYDIESYMHALRPPPLPSLTRLILQVDLNVRSEWFLSVVAQYTNLTFLRVAVMDYLDRAPHQPDLDFTPNRVTLPVLRTLELEHHTHQLLPYLRAPQLESIMFEQILEEYWVGNPFRSFLGFLAHKPAPPLRTLKLREVSADETGPVLACLAVLPLVEYLLVTWGTARATLNSELFEPLFMRRVLDQIAGGAPLLPRLKSLELDIVIEWKRIRSAARRFVESRRAPSVQSGCAVAALVDVKVHYSLDGPDEGALSMSDDVDY